MTVGIIFVTVYVVMLPNTTTSNKDRPHVNQRTHLTRNLLTSQKTSTHLDQLDLNWGLFHYSVHSSRDYNQKMDLCLVCGAWSFVHCPCPNNGKCNMSAFCWELKCWLHDYMYSYCSYFVRKSKNKNCFHPPWITDNMHAFCRALRLRRTDWRYSINMFRVLLL